MTRHTVRVYFEDTDFTGRVYHGAFIRFLERGRTELLRERGLDHSALAAEDRYFTIRDMTVSFHGPALIDDLLTVTATPRGMRASATIDQTVLRGEAVLCRASVELCLIDGRGRPVRPSAQLRAALSGG
ncbi:MAG: YbgC/FadM family acyl-CoA thioesterase [Pseudomonadota bacterium]